MTDTILSAGAISTVHLDQNVRASLILAGCDVGPDHLFGTADDAAFTTSAATGDIGALWVGGNMSRTSIAANVAPGPDGMFGTGDDPLLSSSLAGTIGSITVVGTLSGSTNSGEHFGIVAHGGIGSVAAGGAPLVLPYLYGNIIVPSSWV